MSNPDEHIKRTDEGASLQVEITRGEGTRDQEKWRIKGKGATALQAISEFIEQYEEVFGEKPEGEPLADHARRFSPGDGDND